MQRSDAADAPAASSESEDTPQNALPGERPSLELRKPPPPLRKTWTISLQDQQFKVTSADTSEALASFGRETDAGQVNGASSVPEDQQQNLCKASLELATQNRSGL